MPGTLGADFNPSSPAEVDQGSGGAFSLRDIKARIIAFFAVLFDLNTGLLQTGVVPSSALVDQVNPVAGTWNKFTNDPSGLVTLGANNTKAADWGGLNGALTAQSVVPLDHGGTGLNTGPAGPGRILKLAANGQPNYALVQASPSISPTISDVSKTVQFAMNAGATPNSTQFAVATVLYPTTAGLAWVPHYPVLGLAKGKAAGLDDTANIPPNGTFVPGDPTGFSPINTAARPNIKIIKMWVRNRGTQDLAYFQTAGGDIPILGIGVNYLYGIPGSAGANDSFSLFRCHAATLKAGITIDDTYVDNDHSSLGGGRGTADDLALMTNFQGISPATFTPAMYLAGGTPTIWTAPLIYGGYSSNQVYKNPYVAVPGWAIYAYFGGSYQYGYNAAGGIGIEFGIEYIVS